MTIDNYKIIAPLDKGSFGLVYKAIYLPTNTLCALKILRKDIESAKLAFFFFFKEYKMMSNINHQHILKPLDFNTKGKLTGKQGDSEKVAYMALPFLSKGDLHGLVSKFGKVSRNTSRFLMKQIVSAVYYLHTEGIAHRDIKLENIMLDEEFNAKLIDFGFCIKADPTMKEKLQCGTYGYMSPQMKAKIPYDAFKSDVFALGVTLFTLRSGRYPFDYATLKDKTYKAFLLNKDYYWKHFSKNLKIEYCAEFKSLINGMLAYDEEERFSVFDVMKSPFLKGKIDKESAKKELKSFFGSG